MLTTSIDTMPGLIGSLGNANTDGNDSVVALVDAATTTNTTLNSLDVINGGLGINTMTLNFVGDTTNEAKDSLDAIPTGVTISNVQTLNVRAAGNVGDLTTGNLKTFDVSAIAGLTTLNVTQAIEVDTKAAATTDINVSGVSDAIVVNGGKNVSVTDANFVKDITIGATTVSKGAVVVNDSKVGTATIAIDGGTDVTVNATGSAATGKINIGQTTAASGAVVVNSTGAASVASTDVTLHAINIDGGKTIAVTQKATSDASAAAADKVGATIKQGDVTIVAAATTTDVTVKQDATVAETLATNQTGGVTETASAKFSALTAGQTIVMGGLTFTAPAGMTAAEAAAAFANLVDNAAFAAPASILAGDTQSAGSAAKGTYSGTFAGWTSAAANGDTVVFTSTTANAVVADLANTGSGTVTVTTTQGKANDAGASGGVLGVTAGVVDITGGAALAKVTVEAYSGASQIKGATNTVLATVNLSNGGNFAIASAAATLALNLTNVNGTVDVQAGTTTLNATVNGNTATTQSTLKSASATTVKVDGAGHVAGTTAAGNLSAATAINTTGMTAGTATFVVASGTATTYTGGAAADSVSVLNAGTAITKAIDLGAGDDTLTLVGATVAIPTAILKGGEGTDTLSIDVASAAALDGDKNFSAKLDSFEHLTLNNAGVGVETIDLVNLGFANYVTTSGSAGTLTLDKLANNGTVVLTATPTIGVTVKVADAATGTADVLNVVLSSTGNLAAGLLTAANVETVNISTEDTQAAPQTKNVDSLTLTADKATSVNLTGAADLTLTLTSSTKVTSIDGSAMTGGLTVTSLNTTSPTTIKGGSGNDVLTAATGSTADVLLGGAGNDVLVANAGLTTMTGGEGADVFHIATASLNVNSYATITDFAAGDLLQIAGIDSFASAKVTLGATAVFQDYANAAINALGVNDAGWFQYGGDTYVVADVGADTSAFVNGSDLIVKITGLVDLTNASYNSTSATIAL